MYIGDNMLKEVNLLNLISPSTYIGIFFISLAIGFAIGNGTMRMSEVFQFYKNYFCFLIKKEK